MKPLRTLRQIAAYIWVAPNTLLGLLAGALVLSFGGTAQRRRGVIEFSGGALGVVAGKAPRSIRFSAVTFGHVILAIGQSELAAAREHEHVHVRQYELWGPFFLLAYAASSTWQVLRGRRAYSDNYFERQAYAIEEHRPGVASNVTAHRTRSNSARAAAALLRR